MSRADMDGLCAIGCHGHRPQQPALSGSRKAVLARLQAQIGTWNCGLPVSAGAEPVA